MGVCKVYMGVNKVYIRCIWVYSYLEKGCRQNVHATIPKGNM